MDQSLQEKLQKLQREAEERDAMRMAEKSGIPYADLALSPVKIDALKLISEEEARGNKMAAIALKVKKLAVAAYDPTAPETIKVIEDLKQKGYEVSVFTVSLYGLKHVWESYKFVGEETEEITGAINIEKSQTEELAKSLTTVARVKEALSKLDFTKAIVTNQILETILSGALANRASDIHMEPGQTHGKIRFRLDGLLNDIFDGLETDVYNRAVSRLKLLSALKIDVKNIAQDGRFTIKIGDKEIEIRTSIIPSEFGETVVMRVLDPAAIKLSLEDLGMRADDLEIVKRSLARPNGLILNTGPTGSGKTTSLYAFLRNSASQAVKIVTVEDPIEYHLEGISQTQVNPETGYTFASGLRSILRQDPDIILVGEVRDAETSDIAMQAALTGHLVFSTLHTNSAAGAIPRLIDLGAKAATIGPALALIMAQRLVRRLCEHCKVPKKIDEAMDKKIQSFLEKLPARVNKENFKEVTLFDPVGCEECNGTGYRGRIGIYEFLEKSDELERLILTDTSELAVRDLALSQGMVNMQDDGVLKVLKGVTTFDEVTSITGPIKSLF